MPTDWGQGAQGAAGGALTGAAVGSYFGPYGTAVGAIGGGLIGGAMGLWGDSGGPKYDEELRKRLLGLEQDYQTRAWQEVSAAQANQSQFRTNQSSLITQLEAMGRGDGPSAATLQMREGLDRVAGAQSSMAGGAVGRGVNAGAALREASNNTAGAQSQIARDTGLARVQEQLGAINQLGLTIHGARTADETVNQFNAAQTNQVALANAQRQLQIEQLKLNALAAAGGTYHGTTTGTGSAVLAGGANTASGVMAARGAGQQAGAGGVPSAPAQAPAGNPAGAAPPNFGIQNYPGQPMYSNGGNPYGPQPGDPNTPVPNIIW